MLLENCGNYIITGAPGTGKSTLLMELARQQFPAYEEINRRIISEQLQQSYPILPWTDIRGFVKLALRRMLEQNRDARTKYHTYNKQDPSNWLCFFDRGIPDLSAYLETYQVPELKESTESFMEECCYEPKVFLTPVWKEIYENEDFRPETFDTASNLDQSLRCTYNRLGFNIVELPFASVQERVAFIMNSIKEDYPDVELPLQNQ